MRKKCAALLCCLFLALPLYGLAENAAIDTELEGFVTELVDGGFVMEDKDMGAVLLNTDDATVWDGVLAEEEIALGQYVIVKYDGRLTKSIPPQAHADKVGCYVLNGLVSDVLEDGMMLMEDETFGSVLVNLEAASVPVFPGVPVTVYYDGVMALSLPGMVNARLVETPALRGVVSEATDEGFTLTDDAGATYSVLLTPDTRVVAEAAQAEPAEDAEDAPAEEPAEAAPTEVPAEEPEYTLADGDVVTVYHDGAEQSAEETQSEKLQPITALEIVIAQA